MTGLQYKKKKTQEHSGQKNTQINITIGHFDMLIKGTWLVI